MPGRCGSSGGTVKHPVVEKAGAVVRHLTCPEQDCVRDLPFFFCRLLLGRDSGNVLDVGDKAGETVEQRLAQSA
jgi:hypothetical protein